jgi:5-methylcytosine-specific restriction enzyme subunit McrC
MLYTFKDSSSEPRSGIHLPLLLAAVDRLNEAIQKGEVPLVSLRGDERPFRSDMPGILSYAVKSTDAAGKRAFTITEAHFEVSYFIGTHTTKIGSEVVTLQIQPRWGSGILSYLLQYTTGIYQPPDPAAATAQQKDSAAWLLVMLWKSLFNQALRRCHIPKEYRERKTNDRFFRGRLDVPRQIRENSVDQSRFACVDAPLTLDTTISRTIRHMIRLLAKPGAYPALMRDLAGFEERLAAFGVSEKDVKPADIAKICYTRLSIGYRPLMQASLAILRRFGGSTLQNAASETPSYFIDLAELWENYLLAILQRYLPSEYRIWSPNETGGTHLLAGEKRAIRPDILIEKSGQIVAVLDAKFKNYTQIGRCEKGGVSREDLYQMGTYLYHYSGFDRPILGLFVTPTPGAVSPDVETLSHHPLHRLGVVAFDITSWDDKSHTNEIPIANIRKAEETFAKVVEKELAIQLTALPSRYGALLDLR